MLIHFQPFIFEIHGALNSSTLYGCAMWQWLSTFLFPPISIPDSVFYSHSHGIPISTFVFVFLCLSPWDLYILGQIIITSCFPLRSIR